jgi:hypothetical protein
LGASAKIAAYHFDARLPQIVQMGPGVDRHIDDRDSPETFVGCKPRRGGPEHRRRVY